MRELTVQEFIEDTGSLVVNAVENDDFLKIKTSAGNAVLISEAEWNILTDALSVLLGGAKVK